MTKLSASGGGFTGNEFVIINLSDNVTGTYQNHIGGIYQWNYGTDYSS